MAPILKPNKKPEDPTSYRPISLLNSISKLTEAFIAQQLDKHIDDNNIIAPYQYGFRKGLSAPMQVYRLVEHITTAKIKKQFTAAVFLDIEKAFDKVWLFGLIFKLINYNFPPYLIKLIFSYLLDRNFHVKVKDKWSRKYFAKSGIPQGSRISALLFSLFINDIPSYPHTYLAIYADDTCIFSIKRNRRYAIAAITAHLKILSIWFKKWRIAINVNKTEAILFCNLMQDTMNRHKISFNQNKLDWSDNVKYLGVILDRRLTFKKHIKNTRNKFRAAKNKLYPLLARDSRLSIKNKLLLYASFLRPILTYSCQVWSMASKTNLELLIQSQNATLRLIYDIPYYVRNYHLYREINFPRLNDFIQHLNINFHTSLLNSENPTIQNLPAYDVNDSSNRKRPKIGIILNSLL